MQLIIGLYLFLLRRERRKHETVKIDTCVNLIMYIEVNVARENETKTERAVILPSIAMDDTSDVIHCMRASPLHLLT